MKIYINKHKELVLAPEKYEKFGGVSNETIQIKNFSDFEETLTCLVEGEFNRDE